MSFDPQFALAIMLPLAEAAYDLTKLPKDFQLIASVQPDDFGFVAATSDDVIAIAFRGTQHETEWLEDFAAVPVPCRFGSGLVHMGIQIQYSALRNSITDALLKAGYKKKKLWITGHSLGGGLAVLCARDLACNPLTVTWAAPRVGMHDFAETFDQLITDCYRVVNKWDIVPHLPSAIHCYQHVGTGVELNGGLPHSLADAHSLELSYRPGLQRVINQLAAKKAVSALYAADSKPPAAILPMGKVV